ncbi:M48 family metalloprotease [Qipengyuania sediminis]|uniref:M48 family metalloprotease n=1 Tax=Qipengyuania sediminis TaxID=1532023 RepID=UPI0010593D7C|nr:M48 family metalloprotease [Qipengyuania sediminis]
MFHRIGARLAAIALACVAAQPVSAQSLLRDTETEAFFQDLAAPLVKAADLPERNVDIALLSTRSINAFVAGGQIIYLHAGLIEKADTAAEVQGVIAHELGHITGGHIIRQGEGARAATNISLLSLLAGIGAVLAGAGDAGMAAMMMGQRAAIGKFLAYSRGEEGSADAAGAAFLSKAGISGRGSLAFFEKLAGMEMRYAVSRDAEIEYIRSHPLTSDRIATLRDVYERDPAWGRPYDVKLQARFERVKAKLIGYLGEPAQTLRQYPPTDLSVAGHYARAYAYHKQALVPQALAETRALIAKAPEDPYFLELEGQILLESGQPDAALAVLARATALTNAQPLIATLYGHALLATENPKHHEEAERVLRAAVARDRYNPFAWRQLGTVYAARGDMPRANLASAEQQVMSGDYLRAVRSARTAQAGLVENSADWLRAQDIEMQARSLLERQEKQNRGRAG